MKWKDTAEFVGIGAIVASLIFVGLQMRQEQEIARAQALSEHISVGVDFQFEMTEHSDILVKGNSGEALDDVERHKLRAFMEAAEDRVFLQIMLQQRLRGNLTLTTTELKFASFLYRNPVARAAWIQLADDMERYVDPLRTPASLAGTRAAGSTAFRERVK